MTSLRSRAPWLLVLPAAVYLLYFFHLGAAGLLGPDEPRYASIARQMARSGDWVTPVLWGAPWFEKPVLLYWMSGLGFAAGLSPELAPRLPVALTSIGFLAFFYSRMRLEFGPRAAAFSAAILGTSGGWLAFSHVAVTDLPLSAAFFAAVLLALPWVARHDETLLPFAAALLGLAVLAKGLAPLILILPVLWFGRRRWRDLLRARVWLPFAGVAAPWYALCYARNGWPFIQEFFVEHHLGRFTHDALLHRQPFWFFVPILLAALAPWTPAAALLARRGFFDDVRLRLLAAVFGFGFLFFSVSTNKLPAYILPLIPAVAAMAGVALVAARRAEWALAGCGLLLAAWPLAAAVLPASVARGLSRSTPPRFEWTWLVPMAVAAIVFALERGGRRAAAVSLLAAGSTAGVVLLKARTYPLLDAHVSARLSWRRLEPCRAHVCVEKLHRAVRYGLNYYSVHPLPDCRTEDRRIRLNAEWLPAQIECRNSLTGLPPAL